ncbi:MAG: glycosyl hydrolase family 18 protein [Lachnospirales bacterium]
MKKTRLFRRFKILLIFILLLFTLLILVKSILPSWKHISINDAYGVNRNEITFLIDGNYVFNYSYPKLINGDLYVPFDFVKAYVDEYIFWEPSENKITITTLSDVMRFNADKTTAFFNGEEVEISTPIKLIEAKPYIPVTLLENLYDFNYNLTSENIFVYDTGLVERSEYKILKKTKIRLEANIKSDIVYELPKGENFVYVYEKVEDFYKIRSETGIIGYIKQQKMEEINYIPPKEDSVTIETSSKISLAWDQIYNFDANFNENKRNVVKGLNVLSPTWFTFDESSDGSLISVGDTNYVDWAHSNGYKVWAMIMENESKDRTNKVLSLSENRDRLIREILAYIKLYNLDGINIDFEKVSSEDGHLFTQFLRELYPYVRNEGKILSVDLAVPRPWTSQYDQSDISKTVDYICLMAYDEHTSVSEVSGPVASIGFVEEAIKDTLENVPKEKLLMGIPFYVRVWREEIIDGKYTKSIKGNMYMDTAKEFFLENNGIFVWDDVSGYSYGEFTTEEEGNTVTYKAWLENEASVERKMELYKKYDLAGVASWSRGMETDKVWDVIDNYLE